MRERAFREVWLDDDIILNSPSLYEAEPTITALRVARQVDSSGLEIKWAYLDWQSTVEGSGDVVPLATVDLEHRDKLIVFQVTPRSSLDIRVEGLSPSLRWTS